MINSRRVEDLEPDTQALCRKWCSILDLLGIRYLITSTKRDQEYQDALYEQGRTKPGKIVTWTHTSRHIKGTAWDFVIKAEDGTLDWGMKLKDDWNLAIAIGKKIGMSQVIGSDGKVKEYAHLQKV